MGFEQILLSLIFSKRLCRAFVSFFLLIVPFTFVNFMTFYFLFHIFLVTANFGCMFLSTGDALHSLRINLVDPNNNLQSWDPTLVNPCTWFHVTCNNDNSVTRV